MELLPSSTFLMPYNYFDWKPKILLLLRSRGLYQITMTKNRSTSIDEKNHFLNRQDMAFRLICMSVSLEIQSHVVSLSTPDEVWTKLEVLFGIKEDCEECMSKIDKTKPTKNPPEEQASWLPLEVYLKDVSSCHSNQISDLISESYLEVHEHSCVDPEPRPKWAQSILPTTNYLVGDLTDPRRMRSQFEGDPHALIAT
jgi:hypothetical protein